MFDSLSGFDFLRRLGLVSAVVGALAIHSPAQSRFHVDAGAAPGGDGLAWASAFHSLDDALVLAGVGDEVWVKAGTYVPNSRLDRSDPRTATFNVNVGISLYGGFDGTESSLSQRAGLFDQTILSGDLGVPGDISDNAFHVVHARFLDGIPPAANRIDGFTIRDANGTGAVDQPGAGQGGGIVMFNQGLWISNCIIRDNVAIFGGGLHAQPAIVRVTWTQFINNHATEKGGAIWGQALNCKVSHCVFDGNSSDKGGALYFHSTANDVPGLLPITLIHNSVLQDNRARIGGAAFLGGAPFASGKATFSSCTIAYNQADQGGGGIWAASWAGIPARSTLFNCIVWNNFAPLSPNLHGRQAAIACNIESGVIHGSRNIRADPLFVDGPNRDLHLGAGSPCVDRCGNPLVPIDFADVNGNGVFEEIQSLDLDGNPRFVDEASQADPENYIDMGAYERP